MCYFRRKFDEYAVKNDILRQGAKAIGSAINMMTKGRLINSKITNVRVTAEDIDRFDLKSFTKEELGTKEGYEDIRAGHQMRCIYGVLTNDIMPKTFTSYGDSYIGNGHNSVYADGQYVETKRDKPPNVGAINYN